MLKTFKKILNPEQAAAQDAAMMKAAAKRRRIDEALDKLKPAQGPYNRALRRTIEKTGKTRGVKLPPSEKSIAPYGSVTLYNDSQVKGQFKQWSIWREGPDVVTEWGRTGSTLQTKRKSHASDAAAARQVQKTIKTKRLEGYRNRP